MSGCYGDSSDSQHRSPAQVIPSYLLGGTITPMRLGPRRTLTSNCIFDRFCRFCKTHNMRAKQTNHATSVTTSVAIARVVHSQRLFPQTTHDQTSAMLIHFANMHDDKIQDVGKNQLA